MAEAVTYGSNTPDIHLDYKPQSAKLREFHKAKGFVRIIIGPLGSGKTQASLAEMYRRIHNQKKRTIRPGEPPERISRWAVVRNTYSDLQNTTIKDFREMFASHEERGAMTFTMGAQGASPTAKFYYRRGDGTVVRGEVVFLAYDRPEDQRKARGLQITGLWLNEVKELNQTVVNQLCGRVGRFPARADLGDYWQGVIGDCNAPDSDHWLGKMALGTADPEMMRAAEQYGKWDFVIQPGAVEKKGDRWVINPKADNLHNLPKGYYPRQIAGAVNEAWIRVNLGNEFVLFVDGRPVHPDFKQLTHAPPDFEPEAVPGRGLVVGIDFGRTPAAAIMQQQVAGNWYVLDEVTTVNTGAKKFGRVLKRFLNEHYEGYTIEFWGDPAGDDMAQTDDESPLDMLATEDIDCLPAPTNDFETRITALDALLMQLIEGTPAILISHRCSMMIKGLAGAYQFARVATSHGDRYHDRPKKSPESHVVEALHYGLLGAGEGDRLFESGAQEQATVEADEDFEGWHPAWTGL